MIVFLLCYPVAHFIKSILIGVANSIVAINGVRFLLQQVSCTIPAVVGLPYERMLIHPGLVIFSKVFVLGIGMQGCVVEILIDNSIGSKGLSFRFHRQPVIVPVFKFINISVVKRPPFCHAAEAIVAIAIYIGYAAGGINKIGAVRREPMLPIVGVKANGMTAI